MASELEKVEATKEIVKSIRDLISLKITLPLGNPNLKLVHTNQFLFTELPNDVFELANMETISTAMNSIYSRFGGYQVNRWYIEGVTITNNGGNATMDLDLNPYATDLEKYKENLQGLDQAYVDASKQGVTTSATKTTNEVASTSIKFSKVSGQSASDQAYIESVVTTALKNAGNPKDDLKRAKAIHEHYKKNHVYKRYCCMSSGGFKSLWNEKSQNCGTGARTLCLMFKSIGLDCTIFNGHNHFWVRLTINGKYYYCDQSGSSGSSTTRVLGAGGGNGNVWKGTSGGSNRGWNYVCGRYSC